MGKHSQAHRQEAIHKPDESRSNVYENKHPNFIQMQVFTFRTFEQARKLALDLSEKCPNNLKIQIGLNELFMNAIEHGNLGITYEEKSEIIKKNTWLSTIYNRLFQSENKSKQVTVRFEKTPTRITIKIKDCGHGFQWQPFLSHQHNTNCHGRGILIAKDYAFDELYYNNKGNEVTCYLNI